jgi:hypothetical protein
LLVGPERDERRTQQRLADVAEASRGAGAGVLLVEDDLADQALFAAAVRARPAEADPAGLAQVPLPGEALVVKRLFVAGAAAPAHDGELGREGRLQPVAALGAEGLVLLGKSQVHGRRLLDPPAG